MKASSRSVYSSCSNHDPLDPWGPIRVSNLFIRMYMYIIIIIVAQVRDLVRGPFVYILSICEFFFKSSFIFSKIGDVYWLYTDYWKETTFRCWLKYFLLRSDCKIFGVNLYSMHVYQQFFPYILSSFFWGGRCSVPKFCKTYCWFWIKTITRFYI